MPATKARFEVPVIYSGTNDDENLYAILDTLEHLESVSNNVFNAINSKISSQRQRLDSFSNRLSSCQNAVNSVAQRRTKATTVLSEPLYPGQAHAQPFASPFDTVNELDVPERTFKIRPEGEDYRDISTTVSSTDGIRVHAALVKEHIEENAEEGLGRLPHHIPSVSSLLLFNTSENPYKKYVSIDNLAGVEWQGEEEKAEELAAAPTTVLEGDTLPQFAGIEYSYKPTLGPVPELALAATLPGLEGVAEVSWQVSEMEQIAPSSVLASLPTLPSVEETAPAAPAAAAPASSAPPPPASNAAPPPPPSSSAPPPPPASSAPPPPPPAANAPPPPPPPAANAPPPPPPAGGDGGAAPPPPAAPSGGRNALLESIRNPNVKLKKVGNRKEPEPKADSGGGKKAASANPMDLMSALKGKLSIRRKGIRGSKGDDDDDEPPRPPKPAPAAAEAAPPPPIGDNPMASMIQQVAQNMDDGDDDDDSDWE